MKLQYVYGMSITLMVLLVDQLKHVALEALYVWIGADTAFHIWLLIFILEILGMVWQKISTYTTCIKIKMWCKPIKVYDHFNLFLCRPQTCIQFCHNHECIKKITWVSWLQRQKVPWSAVSKQTNSTAKEDDPAPYFCPGPGVEEDRGKEDEVSAFGSTKIWRTKENYS